MNLELQAELFGRHPRVFRRAGDAMASGLCVFDERGVECGDGWFDLIDGLARAVEEEIECLARRGVPRDRWPRAVQIKEKFGTLRFRLQGPRSDALKALILMAEEDSWRTCEGCGQPSGLAAHDNWPVCVCCCPLLERKYLRASRSSPEARAESQAKRAATLTLRAR